MKRLWMTIAFVCFTLGSFAGEALMVSSQDPGRWPAPAVIVGALPTEKDTPYSLQTIRIAFNPAVLSAAPYGHVISVRLSLFKDREWNARKKAAVLTPPAGTQLKGLPYVRPDQLAQQQMFFRMKIEADMAVELKPHEIVITASAEEFYRYALVITLQAEATKPFAEGMLAYFLSDLPVQPLIIP